MSDHGQSENKPFHIGSSIPVIRMLDEAASKSFYIDYLGYQIDWEHRFRDDPESPLYLQVSLGESRLHLNGHADQSSPVCEVRVPVDGIDAFCQFLSEKTYSDEKPEVVDPRYAGENQDLNLIDPSGNHIVFWRPSGK